MDLFVVIALVALFVGLVLAVSARYRGTTAALTDHPDQRGDHPGDAGHDAFEQVVDDRGKR
ncbi:MAG TPA: hypothetical protein VE526_05195 [Solirubrobacteraceae bacterium]|nr:hypothetical protein [Solirubrobacteraceae bacterium]